MLLTWSVGDVLEVAVTAGLIVVVMGVMAAIPFAVQFYIEDVRKREE